MAAQPDFRGRRIAHPSEQADVREYEMPDIAPAAGSSRLQPGAVAGQG